MGAAVGSIRDLFTKIKAINAKHGQFDFVLCTGDFFGPLRDADEGGESGSDDIAQLLDGKLDGTF